ncbi:aldo/keto reductase [Olivibacter ginsenosidimutans]|uniref:Aldo/keto reductase n=1 Tax=Olivibacter ginsenosidimutans TaxID=1176537 RepID=A0ABP9BVV6_9SPHI
MIYRKLGQTDLELSVITFGAWAAGGWMWGSTDRKQAIEAIKASYEVGVSSIDTAPIYGQGTSEEIVGEAIKEIPRDRVQLLTKFGMRWDLSSPKGDFAMHSADNNGHPIDIYKYAGQESVIKECEDSLRRLGTDYIDLLQIHWPDSTTPIAETFEAVAKLIEQGKVRYAGVCNYHVEQMKEAEQVLSLASNQVPFSMVQRDIQQEVVPYCLEQHKGILAYSPLQRGLLTGKIKPGHHFAAGDSREGSKYYTDAFIRATNAFLEKLKPLAEEKNATLAQLVLRWTVEQPGITVALAGARNAQQSVQNAAAMNIDLSEDEIGLITKWVDAL